MPENIGVLQFGTALSILFFLFIIIYFILIPRFGCDIDKLKNTWMVWECAVNEGTSGHWTTAQKELVLDLVEATIAAEMDSNQCTLTQVELAADHVVDGLEKIHDFYAVMYMLCSVQAPPPPEIVKQSTDISEDFTHLINESVKLYCVPDVPAAAALSTQKR